MPVAYFYIRFSHEDSARENGGVSADVQLRDCEEYFRWNLAPKGFQKHPEPFTDEAVSAYHNLLCERPAGKRLLGIVQPGDAIVTRQDRSFRNAEDALTTLRILRDQMGVRLCLVDLPIDTNTPAGKLSYTMSAAVAEMESARRSERIVNANATRRELGLPINSAPKGFLADWVTYDLAARARMQEVVRLRDVELWSYKKIIAYLRKKGLKRGITATVDDYWTEKAIQRLEATGKPFTGHDVLWLSQAMRCTKRLVNAKTSRRRFFEIPAPSRLVAALAGDIPQHEFRFRRPAQG